MKEEINTTYIERGIATLGKAYAMLQKQENGTIEYDMYRSACIKEFEIILEQSGKLLKKLLKQYFHSSQAVDRLVFKDIFRHAAIHQIISTDAVERWLKYRDNRNITAHDYGAHFAEETVLLLPAFLEDVKNLVVAVKTFNDR